MWVPITSFLEKAISAFGASNSPISELSCEPYMVMIWRAYLLQEDLVSPLSTNPPTMVLRVWQTTMLSPLLSYFPFLDHGLPRAPPLLELDSHDPQMELPLAYFFR